MVHVCHLVHVLCSLAAASMAEEEFMFIKVRICDVYSFVLFYVPWKLEHFQCLVAQLENALILDCIALL